MARSRELVIYETFFKIVGNELSGLAAGAFNAREGDLARAFTNCEGAAAIAREVARLIEKLTRPPSENRILWRRPVSSNLVQRLTRSKALSVWGVCWRVFRAPSLNCRIVVAAMAAPLDRGLIVSVVLRQPICYPSIGGKGSEMWRPHQDRVDPTISNYQMLANRSLDKLDEHLSRQESETHLSGSTLHCGSAFMSEKWAE